MDAWLSAIRITSKVRLSRTGIAFVLTNAAQAPPQLNDRMIRRKFDKRQKTSLKSSVREGGGSKHILEDASSQFCNQAESEITDPIDRLRPKLGARVQQFLFDQMAETLGADMVRVSCHPAAPTFKYALRCTGSIIRVLVRMA